jgi:ABC-2 type transport system ATP-binding protein
MNPVEVRNISKSYNKGTVRALNDVSFDVLPGEIFGLLGPDGAGKTTLFRILTTLILPDSGSAAVNNHDVVRDFPAIRHSVGYMPGRFSLYQDLTIEENLNFFATVFNTTVEENYHLIRDIYVQIEPFRKRRAGKLSGGMKQKLALCCALIHKPEVLFLDEPTTGVDPVSRQEFWSMLKGLKEQGISIVVSTPYMDEATLCDRIALIQDGRILSVNTPQNIISSYPQQLFAIRASNTSALLRALAIYPKIESNYAFGEFVHATFKENGETDVLNYLATAGLQDTELHKTDPTVEDCFIRLLKN